MTNTISIIIPVRNGGKPFARCLQGIEESITKPLETIVVVDGSPDKSTDIAQKFNVKIIQLPENKGPAFARNRGAEAATGDVLWFVDADVEIRPDSLETLCRTMDRQPEISVVFGSYDDSPWHTNFMSQFKNLFHHYVHQTSNTDATTFWAGCGAVRRKVFLELGGFDENYSVPSIEDIELGFRMKTRGHQIFLLKNLQVKHLKQWRVLSMLKADILYRAVPWTRLIVREKSLPDTLNLQIKERISAALVWLAFLLAPASLIRADLLVPLLIVILTLIITNRKLYLFFYRLRGCRFTLAALLWHWAYFAYSALTFAIITLESKVTGKRR